MSIEACSDHDLALVITPPQPSPPTQPKRKRDEDSALTALTWDTYFDPVQRAAMAVSRTKQSCVPDALLWRSHLVSQKIQELRHKVDERILCLTADLCVETLASVPESADWKQHVDRVLAARARDGPTVGSDSRTPMVGSGRMGRSDGSKGHIVLPLQIRHTVAQCACNVA